MLGIESRVGLSRNAWFLGTAFGSASLMVATSNVGLDGVTAGVACPSTPGTGKRAIAGAIAIPNPRNVRVRVIQSVHLVCGFEQNKPGIVYLGIPAWSASRLLFASTLVHTLKDTWSCFSGSTKLRLAQSVWSATRTTVTVLGALYE